MKKYTFFAKTNPKFMSSLISEIQAIAGLEKINSLKHKRLNLIKFEAPMDKVWRILLYSRLAEDVKIQIKENLNIKTEKDLKIMLARSDKDFANFLPMENSTNFLPPQVKAYSFRSDLFHEKMIENITKVTLNKLAHRSNNPDEANTVESNDNKRSKKAQSEKGLVKEKKIEKKLKASDLDLNNKEELIKKLEKRANLLQIPRIDLIFQENKLRILLNLTNNPLYKHEYKEKQNWGSLRETYAAALFYESELIEKMNQQKSLFFWDPFCGAGTLAIEAFSIIFQRQARKLKTIAEEGFTNLPFNKKDEFSKFLKEELKLSTSYVINIEEKFDCKFICSDINNKSLTALSENCKSAKLNNFKVYSENNLLNKVYDYNKFLNPVIFHEKINNVFNAFLGDFEAIAKNVVFSEVNKNNKFNIFTHLPYGVSQQMDDRIKIKKLYERFGKFIRKNNEQLDDVFVIVNKRDEKDRINFKLLSGVKWNAIVEFENNGITVEMLKYIRD